MSAPVIPTPNPTPNTPVPRRRMPNTGTTPATAQTAPNAPTPPRQPMQAAMPRAAVQPLGMSAASGGAPPAPTPSSPTAAPGVSLTPTNPSNDLRSQTITPGAATDRYGIAQQQFDTFAQSTDPAYQKTLRDADRSAAGKGQLGSGMYRTSLGDAANLRSTQLDTARQGFLTDALNGSIDDAYKNLGIAQQQQQYQTSLQDQGFNQNLAAGQFQNATQAQQFGQDVTSQQLAAAQQAQQFGQGITQAQLENATQGQQFGQDVTRQQLAASQQAQEFGQGITAQQLQNATQGQAFGQDLQTQQLLASLQNQLYGQDLAGKQFNNQTQQQQFNQGVTQQELQNSTQAQQFGQGITSAQLAAALQGQQFGQGVTQATLSDALTNSSFNRDQARLNAGSSGNPSDLELALSQIFGNQSSAASGALAGLIGNKTNASSSDNGLQSLLAALGLGAQNASPEAQSISSILGATPPLIQNIGSNIGGGY